MELVQQEWFYPDTGKGSKKTELSLHAPDWDVTGGKIRISDIDVLANYPNVKPVTISGLSQDTFEYFIQTYGGQLKYIEFFKNKSVEDWSLLGSLPELECVDFFHNQRITKMWDMRKNYALKAIFIEDFTRLHDLSGVEKAPSLEWFYFGDAVWSTSVIDSLTMFATSPVKRISFYGKKIEDMDLSFVPQMSKLEILDFPRNMFSTEQVAWVVANCPNLAGAALKPYLDYLEWNKATGKSDIPTALIVGKRKPTIHVEGNEARIRKYVKQFEEYVKKYRDIPYSCVG